MDVTEERKIAKRHLRGCKISVVFQWVADRWKEERWFEIKENASEMEPNRQPKGKDELKLNM